ncbi:putative glycoside hydrolase [Nocardia jejuensis]|uniref:putative glycoside hydrolase n=1 Tax=Nocardia jejuensis TaxID=328049 RepID=UPI00082993FE|nr:putative glycoside hydrolase [Nocardia jejuensis]
MRVRSDRKRLAVIAFGAILAIVLTTLMVSAGRAEPSGLPLEGLPQGTVGADALAGLDLRVRTEGHDPEDVRLTLDGSEVSGRVDGDAVVFHPEGLSDGPHTFAAEIPAGGPFGFLRTGPGASATFTVDTQAPALEVARPDTVASYRDPVTVRGTASGAERVSIGETSVTPGADGRFEITLPHAPVGGEVVALDAAGNRTSAPIGAEMDLTRMRAVHLTAYGWADDGLREAVLALAREGRIDTIQLDIKDEDGRIGYDSQVPLARESGAVASIYDAPAALKQLHDLHLRVVGRIVAFRDPTMASWAWHSGRTDWVIQTPSGQPYSSHYGPIAFTNFASADIRGYNIALATEAARLGFDGIMYDYVRRPDGSLSSMNFPGISDTPAATIGQFLHESRDPVHAAGAHLAAAVYGIAATRPDEIAQDIPLIARNVDVVAPMLYPSHWNAGEYGVSSPNSEPYDIIFRSLQDFRARTEGTGAQIFPWLQDFSLGVSYGDAQVKAQIDATYAAGMNGYFLWNAASVYHGGAMLPD